MKELLLVFAGGGLGSVLRYTIGRSVSIRFHQPFPLGTLVVNILACLILGFIMGLADEKQMISQQNRLLLVAGFCGGFSTLSAFSYETLSLYQTNHYYLMFFYIALSIV